MNAKKKPSRKPTARPAPRSSRDSSSKDIRASKDTRSPRESRGPDELQRIKEILELMESHGIQELEIGADGRSLRVSKSAPGMAMVPAAAAMAAPAPVPAAAAAAEPAAPVEDEDLEKFLSPMVGTFYRAASPENPPFAVEGDKVNSESILCLIEAMKVFNEIKAEMSGTIVDVLVENGEAVEYGQPLFLIKKSG